VLGLVVALLTLGGGYVLAHREVVPATVALVQFAGDADAAEDGDPADARPGPTTAEILAHIEEVSARHRVSPRLVAAIVAVESRFDPQAVSRRGAEGLMQLMPATAASLDVQDSFDLRENLDGGVRHLRVLLGRYHGDLVLALAAYNAGDRAVIVHRGVPPYPETRRYVLRVLRRYDPAAARAAAARMQASRGPVAPVPPSPRVVLTTAPVLPPPPVADMPSVHGADSP
jgi:hypothetical protein